LRRQSFGNDDRGILHIREKLFTKTVKTPVLSLSRTCFRKNGDCYSDGAQRWM